MDTATGLTAQLTATVNPDVYCVNISDIGNLAGPMHFTIRIAHDVTSSSPGAPTATETFASALALGGASAHTFSVSQAGTVSLTLTSVTPSTIVGIGIGIPGAATPVCSLSSSQNTTARSTPQITILVDAGTYCAEVYDTGNLSTPAVLFSMTIAHP